ncbi:MAG TPA: YegP family protein [Clostridia bacterium]|nr:YegP family protein [Clostridia bacterium]
MKRFAACRHCHIGSIEISGLESTKMAYFSLKRASNQQFMFNLVADNGEIILTSETYTTKASAQGGISAVKANAPLDHRYDRRSSGTQFYFVLRGGNYEVLGTSERYTTQQARETGIAAVKREAPSATVRDLT